MFTGLIEAVGKVAAVSRAGESMELEIHSESIAQPSKPGDSIAVDGVCLTVVRLLDGVGFTAYASPETMRKTTLGDRPPGSRVNLERALTLATPLGGHLVSGHVDATGCFMGYREIDKAYEIRIAAPKEITRLSIKKGSVALDGISLTIVDLADDMFTCWIIPETWERTTLKDRKEGDRMNLESDLIGKYIERLLSGYSAGQTDQRLTDLLTKGGSWGERS